MPSAAEFQELFDNCTSVWTTLNGVNGRLFTSNINGNKLFIPAAGYYIDTLLSDLGSSAYYWSSSYESPENAHSLFFNNSYVSPQRVNDRHFGFAVRAVRPGTPNRSVVPQTSVNESKEEETPTTEEPKDENQR